MATPIQDAYAEQAASGVKRIVSDGEVVEMHDLDQQQAAADREAKSQAGASKQMGIKVFRVRSGRAAPM